MNTGSKGWSWRIVAAVILTVSAGAARGTTYYVSGDGEDSNPGTSPAEAWQTLGQVNGAALKPGDQVLFRRGDEWRGGVAPQSGEEGAPILYGAFGEGTKPVLMGSIELNDPALWHLDRDNIWTTAEPRDEGIEVLPNPSLDENLSFWGLHTEEGAKASLVRDTDVFDSAPAGLSVRCAATGAKGSDIQLIATGFGVRQGALYEFSFRAKATVPFECPSPILMKAGAPWTRYGGTPRPETIPVGAEWQTYSFYISGNATAPDGRFTFFLGGAIPDGGVFCLDTVSFREFPSANAIHVDVGNIIFDGEASCGVKVFEESQLDAQGKFWYDEERFLLKLCSERNPAEYYSDIECALKGHGVDQSNVHHVIYENLWVKYAGSHGIGGACTHHIIVRDCDFSYIGGADQMGGDRTVRFGNGIEFWHHAHDNLVERCRLWEIYDAALTNQANGPQTQQYNITYRNNLIWNSEYSFEYWNRPEDSITRNIRFENNTCFNAGHGWGHAQRPDPSGRHLCFYTSPAQIGEFYVRNNIFFEAKTNAFYAPAWTREQIDALVMDHNCWYQAEGVMMNVAEEKYTMADFDAYRTAHAKEPHSITADPRVLDVGNLDFRLRPDSLCLDTGIDLDAPKTDFAGTAVPQGKATDIGAYESKPE